MYQCRSGFRSLSDVGCLTARHAIFHRAAVSFSSRYHPRPGITDQVNDRQARKFPPRFTGFRFPRHPSPDLPSRRWAMPCSYPGGKKLAWNPVQPIAQMARSTNAAAFHRITDFTQRSTCAEYVALSGSDKSSIHYTVVHAC